MTTGDEGTEGAGGPSFEGTYSAVADAQLDALERADDVDLYNAVLDTCELILRLPSAARSRSTAITTAEGVRLRLPIAGHPPYKVFWSSDGPRIEAVFPHGG